MDVQLISDLRCPYCAGAFRLVRSCRQDGDRLRYGLLECRCFVFPVVDGVLLLSLAKGYGGAEEALQPYVPLQVAALQYLARDDVDGLLSWMRRHVPLAAELIEGTSADYLTIATQLDLALREETRAYLARMGRYEVVGRSQPRFGRVRQLLREFRPPLRRIGVTEQQRLSRLTTYYVSRFFSPRVNSLAMQLGVLPMQGRILSLCCGHGVFENILAADGRVQELVCVDGQFLNLLITRRYASPQASFICHDVQFPLPFADGYFDGVFTSTCLPEIPAQRTFVREAIRVTGERGWTMFDSIWNLDLGVQRVDRLREYRFCQNFFARLEDYLPFFDECAPAGREVGLDIPGLANKYLAGPTWTFGADREATLKARKDPHVSTIVVNQSRFPGFTAPQRPWLKPERLSISPVFDLTPSDDVLNLQRRANFTQPASHFTLAEFPVYPASAVVDVRRCLSDPGYVLDEYCANRLALLPRQFSADRAPIAT